MSHILKNVIQQLMLQKNLDAITCEAMLNEILREDTNSLQTAAVLVLLRSKQETPLELTTIFNYLRKKMLTISTTHPVLDIVGTGGDGANTINISTASSILAASCGVKIAKHGNRAVSSQAGSADVLEALGVNIELSPEKINYCINEVGIGFCFSPNFHPAIRTLRHLRKQLHVPTTFNLLGPLLNPAQAKQYLLGVCDEQLLPTMAKVLQNTGCAHSMIVHGAGIDEISCIAPIKIARVTPNTIYYSELDPADYGFSYIKREDLQGGSAADNAKLLLETFSGKQVAIANTLILNAATALMLYGVHASIAEAIPHAKEYLYSGKALALLKKWIECSHD